MTPTIYLNKLSACFSVSPLPMLNHFFQQKNMPIIIPVAIFTLLFLAFYPTFYISIDEHQYIKNAFLIPTGSIITSQPELFCGGNQIGENAWVSSQPIGKSITLIPFTFLPFDWIFLSGLLTHLLNFALIILILRRMNISQNWAAVYLFIPVFQWGSRTIFPELNVLTLFLAAYYFWLDTQKKYHVLAGFLLGASMVLRYDAVVGPAAFGLQALFTERKKLLPFVAGLALPLLLLLAFNQFTYGGVLSTGYGSVAEQTSFPIPDDFVLSAFTYAALLFIAIPFSLFAVGKSEHRILFWSLAAGTVGVFSYFSPFWHFDFSLPLTFTARLRYFIPVAGLLLVPTLAWYAAQWKHISSRWTIVTRYTKWVLAGGIIALLIFSAVLHAQHNQLSSSRRDVGNIIHNTIPKGSTVLGSADDCVYFIPSFFGEYYYQKIDANTSMINLESDTYLLSISYFTQQDKNAPRQDIIMGERGLIQKFIKENSEQLVELVASNKSANVSIWRVTK